MSDNEKSKYPNIATYVRNVIDPFLISFKNMFSSVNSKLVSIESSQSDMSNDMDELKAYIDTRFDELELGLIALIEKKSIIGDIRLLPHANAELPDGWYYCNNDRFALTSPQGIVLSKLSNTFRANWGITANSYNINVPNLFYSDGRGYFLRAGTTCGVKQIDTLNSAIGRGQFSVKGCGGTTMTGSGVFNKVSETTEPEGGMYRATGRYVTFEMNLAGGSATSSETRPVNITMTPAIFLGV